MFRSKTVYHFLCSEIDCVSHNPLFALHDAFTLDEMSTPLTASRLRFLKATAAPPYPVHVPPSVVTILFLTRSPDNFTLADFHFLVLGAWAPQCHSFPRVNNCQAHLPCENSRTGRSFRLSATTPPRLYFLFSVASVRSLYFTSSLCCIRSIPQRKKGCCFSSRSRRLRDIDVLRVAFFSLFLGPFSAAARGISSSLQQDDG